MTRLRNWCNPAHIQQGEGYSYPAAAMPTWWGQANCGSTDPAAFFPEKGDVRTATLQALKVCKECPVSTQCLQWALDNNELHGIFGGTTPNDRRVLLGKNPKGRAPREFL
ncbi:hypothetical protein GCM10028801_30330 [Nocardioides maradonensis]